MMRSGDEAALLAAVAEEPDDWDRRLMYADWLDLAGQPERAEFIRLQCRLHRDQPEPPGAESLQQRVASLLRQYEARWLGPVANPLRKKFSLRWEAGFPTVAQATTAIIGTEDLKRLARLPALAALHLSHTCVSDAALPWIGRLANLEELSLSGTAVRGSGLADLAGLARLTRLWLDGTGVDDRSLAHLTPLASLQKLDLSGTKLTDAGLPTLLRLPALRELHLAGTKLSPRGYRRLFSQAPHLIAEHEEEGDDD